MSYDENRDLQRALRESLAEHRAARRVDASGPFDPARAAGRDRDAYIASWLAAHGYTNVDVEGDGNCQFRTLALLQYGDEKEHERVRREVCRFIARTHMLEEYAEQAGFLSDELRENGMVKKHGPDERGVSEVFYDDQGQPVFNQPECLSDGVWGTGLTLLAAQRMYNVDIYMRVHNQHWHCIGGGAVAPRDKRFFIEYKLGVHYQAWAPPPAFPKRLVIANPRVKAKYRTMNLIGNGMYKPLESTTAQKAFLAEPTQGGQYRMQMIGFDKFYADGALFHSAAAAGV
jgi:hypothetical protein